MTHVRVLLVDDNDVYRSTLELLLGLEPELALVAAVATAEEARAAVASGGVDVVVTDLRLPGASGVELSRQLAESGGPGVVCLTAEAGAEERAAALEAGAVAVFEKDVPVAEVVTAIRAAARPRGIRLAGMELTQGNTAIVLDSTSDFPDAREVHENMRVVPLYVRFGEDSLKDHVEIRPEQFYERLTTAAALPTTSQPTPHDFLETFEELASFDRIYSIMLSAKLSGTYQSAALAAGELGGDKVIVIDTGTASLAASMLALAIERRLARGTSDAEIAQLIERFKRDHRVVFTVNTLEYLQKGGRIGKAAALAGALLNVKPILSVDDGIIVPIARVRGRQKALQEFARLFTEHTEDKPGLRVGIAHANAPEWIGVLTDLVNRVRPQAEIELVRTLGAVVGTHAGPGAVGFFWFQDD
ncbi:MAG: DegV family protein [Gaiella sp.]